MGKAQRFRGTVRFFRPEQAKGLAVIDIPAGVATALGGLKQMRVRGTLNGIAFQSNTMPAGGGVLAMSVNKTLLKEAGLAVGEQATVEIDKV